MEEQALVGKILARDRHALSWFYHHYSPKLLRFIEGKVNNPHDAEEILQDTLMAFLEAIRDFNGKSKLTTFLYAICQHKIIDHYRKKKMKHLVFSQMPYLENLVSPLLEPEGELDASELKHHLKHAFGSLIPKYRKVLQMKYIEDQTVADIADTCNWTVKATESLLFRARKMFMKVYAGI